MNKEQLYEYILDLVFKTSACEKTYGNTDDINIDKEVDTLYRIIQSKQIERIKELEDIVRAGNTLSYDMYNSNMESTWSRDFDGLQGIYMNKYDIDLSGKYE